MCIRDRADTLQYYLDDLPFVKSASVQERTQSVTAVSYTHLECGTAGSESSYQRPGGQGASDNSAAIFSRYDAAADRVRAGDIAGTGVKDREKSPRPHARKNAENRVICMQIKNTHLSMSVFDLARHEGLFRMLCIRPPAHASHVWRRCCSNVQRTFSRRSGPFGFESLLI